MFSLEGFSGLLSRCGCLMNHEALIKAWVEGGLAGRGPQTVIVLNETLKIKSLTGPSVMEDLCV